MVVTSSVLPLTSWECLLQRNVLEGAIHVMSSRTPQGTPRGDGCMLTVVSKKLMFTVLLFYVLIFGICLHYTERNLASTKEYQGCLWICSGRALTDHSAPSIHVYQDEGERSLFFSVWNLNLLLSNKVIYDLFVGSNYPLWWHDPGTQLLSLGAFVFFCFLYGFGTLFYELLEFSWYFA